MIGTLVGQCVREGKTFADLTDADWAAVHPVFAEEKPPLDAISSIAGRDVPGGTAANRVADALATATEQLSEFEAWSTAQREALDVLFSRPG